MLNGSLVRSPFHVFYCLWTDEPKKFQSRPNIFDLEIRRPELLYKAVVEINERVVLDREGQGGWEMMRVRDEGMGQGGTCSSGDDVVQGLTGEGVRVVKEPDLQAVRSSLQAVLDQGITSLAIVFLHRCVHVCGVTTMRPLLTHRTGWMCGGRERPSRFVIFIFIVRVIGTASGKRLAVVS